MLLLPYFVLQGELTSRFDFSRIVIKILQTRHKTHLYEKTYVFLLLSSCPLVDEAVSFNFEHLRLENNHESQQYCFQVILSDTALQLMNGIRGRFISLSSPLFFSRFFYFVI